MAFGTNDAGAQGNTEAAQGTETQMTDGQGQGQQFEEKFTGDTPESETQMGGSETPADDKGGEGEGEGQQGQEGQQDQGHWSDSIPALNGNDMAKKYATPEEMVEAHGKLLELQEKVGDIPTKLEEVQVTAPEGVDPTDPVLGWFKDKMVERGLGNKLGQEIIQDYMQLQFDIGDRMHEECQTALDSEWGIDKDKKLAVCNDAIAQIDKRIPGFGQWVTTYPNVGSSPMFIKFIEMYSREVGEDSMVSGPAGDTGTRAMSTEQFLLTEVFGGAKE